MNEREIFIEALQQEGGAERSAFLDVACGQDTELRELVERLLAEHEKDGSFFIDSPPPGLGATVDQSPAEQVGTMIGPYKLIEEIGEGGMGSVFMALQKEPVRRKVALKVIKPGMDSKQVVSRFEAERQALAMMDHPSIAKIFDAGCTADRSGKGDRSNLCEAPEGPSRQIGPVPFSAGRPYFVMELVNGIPVTDYCDQYRFTTEQRLELFGQVCQAVQHAHQKGIIHRDLKPSNILVTHVDGRAVPKVIDFGIAKATSGQLTDDTMVSHFAQMIGTPLYMSPEQAELSSPDIDTRSDVYSLGVLLYELLTGTTPFDRERIKEVGYDEFRRIIREEEPPRPSTRLSTLDAALDTVAEKHHTDPRSLSRQLSGELDWIVMKALEKDRTRRYESANELAKDVQRHLDDEPVEACPPSVTYRTRKFVRRHKTVLAATAVVLMATVFAGFLVWSGHQRDLAIAARIEQQEVELQRNVGESLAGAEAVLESGDYAAADRHLAEARTRLDVAQYRAGPLRTAVDELAQRLAGRLHAEDRLEQFQETRHRVHSYMYAVSGAMRDRAQADCQTALGMYGVWEEGSWKERPEYQYLAAGQQAVLDEGIVELLFVSARLEIEGAKEQDDPAKQAESYRRAIGALAKIETHHGSVPSLSRWIAASWRGLGENEKAEEADARAEANPPVTALDYFVQGEFHGQQDDWEQALESYWKALNRDPGHFLSLLAAGVALVELERYEPAETMLTGAIAVNPRTTLAYVKRGTSRLEQGRIALSQFDFDRATELDPDLAHAYMMRAISHYWQRGDKADLEKALADLTEAIRLDPKYPRAYLNRGNVYKALGEDEKALADHNEALRLDPKDPAACAARGDLYRDLGEYEKALADHNEALRVHPGPGNYPGRGRKMSGYYSSRGATYWKMGEYEKALADHNEAIRLDPKDSYAYNFLAWLFATAADPKARDPDRAVELARKATNLSPEEGAYWNTLGVAQYRAGDFNGAMESLGKSMELGSTRSGLGSFDWFFLAMAHWQLGEKDKARQWYNKAVEWMDEHKTKREELHQFRAEAAELLGVKETMNDEG